MNQYFIKTMFMYFVTKSCPDFNEPAGQLTLSTESKSFKLCHVCTIFMYTNIHIGACVHDHMYISYL